jgi:CO dehydrogenase/acetyl-CoA synthase gamma subunit (corrinoid Fe-S protein)
MPIKDHVKNVKWISRYKQTKAGRIPIVKTRLVVSDILGTLRVRWGIKRKNHKIQPGLYAVGNPDSSDPVLVSANYKLSFDALRKELVGINA